MTKSARPVPRERATCCPGSSTGSVRTKPANTESGAMRIDLSGKSAFVSGSTQGIGRAIAARLAECGAVTTINGREQARVDSVLGELRAEQPGARFEGIGADVATASGAAELFAALPEV